MEIENRTYFTLKECMDFITNGTSYTFKVSGIPTAKNIWAKVPPLPFSGVCWNIISDAMDSLHPLFDPSLDSILDNVVQTIYNRYRDEYFYYKNSFSLLDGHVDKRMIATKLLDLGVHMYEKHYDKLKMIKLYKDHESSLMNELKNTTKSKSAMSDAPQNLDTISILSSSGYSSSANQSEVESVTDLPKAQRLKEIQELQRNYIEEIVEDYEIFFYESGNI